MVQEYCIFKKSTLYSERNWELEKLPTLIVGIWDRKVFAGFFFFTPNFLGTHILLP